MDKKFYDKRSERIENEIFNFRASASKGLSPYDRKSEIFKALANPVRLQIIDALLDGEKCVCEIAEKLQCEQSHISKSLSRLKSAGLIKNRKDGLNVYYSLAICCMGEFFSCLNKIIER